MRKGKRRGRLLLKDLEVDRLERLVSRKNKEIYKLRDRENEEFLRGAISGEGSWKALQHRDKIRELVLTIRRLEQRNRTQEENLHTVMTTNTRLYNQLRIYDE